MPIGPGKYDAECTRLRESTHATCAIVIVLGGDKGTGFSCQSLFDITPEIPMILRTAADQIESAMPKAAKETDAPNRN